MKISQQLSLSILGRFLGAASCCNGYGKVEIFHTITMDRYARGMDCDDDSNTKRETFLLNGFFLRSAWYLGRSRFS